MDAQKQQVRDYAGSFQTLFESMLADLLIEQPADINQYLVSSLQAKAAGIDRAPREPPKVTAEGADYAASMKTYLPKCTDVLCGAFEALCRQQPADARVFLMEYFGKQSA